MSTTACSNCRAARRKCVRVPPSLDCVRCLKQNRKCTLEEDVGGGQPPKKRLRKGQGVSCLRCRKYKRKCSSYDSGAYPCDLCVERAVPCEWHNKPDIQFAEDRVEQPTKGCPMLFSLAMNASYDTLAAMDPATIPAAFGLDLSDKTWVLACFPRDIPVTDIDFARKARITNGQCRDSRFTPGFLEKAFGVCVGDLSDKPESKWRQIIKLYKPVPGPPRVARLLEMTVGFDNKVCAVVFHNLFDHTGMCRLQFSVVTILDENVDEDVIKTREGRSKYMGMLKLNWKDEDWLTEGASSVDEWLSSDQEFDWMHELSDLPLDLGPLMD